MCVGDLFVCAGYACAGWYIFVKSMVNFSQGNQQFNQAKEIACINLVLC